MLEERVGTQKMVANMCVVPLCTRHYPKCFMNIKAFKTQNSLVGEVLLLLLWFSEWIERQRHREVKCLTQGHSASKWWS